MRTKFLATRASPRSLGHTQQQGKTMWGSRLVIPAVAALLAAVAQPVGAQKASSDTDDLRNAQLAWGSNPAKRCPELRAPHRPLRSG
jgi:hypothetical protein